MNKKNAPKSLKWLSIIKSVGDYTQKVIENNFEVHLVRCCVKVVAVLTNTACSSLFTFFTITISNIFFNLNGFRFNP